MIYEKQKTQNISFPLGGIGTGCIGLGGNGELKEWEIFNRPNKCSKNGYSHFAVKATYSGKSVVKILQGDTGEELMGTPCASNGHYGFGFGPSEHSLSGLPHFKNLIFEGTFPLANLSFSDDDFPAVVRLCAFNPFIPHDEFNSGLPAAFFEWEIENKVDETVRFAIACTVCNPSCNSQNQKKEYDKLSGIFFCDAKTPKSAIEYSDLCVLTDHRDTVSQEYWYRGCWHDGFTTYWKNLLNLERMPERSYPVASNKDHGTVVAYVEVPARAKAKVRFVIAWNVPNAYNYWLPRQELGAKNTWHNYYSTKFEDSFATAKYALENFDSLYGKTSLFSESLQSCTLPKYVKDAISANLSVIKSPTALRLEDGSFWGWEGCSERTGSCFGTCQHVWNYAYVMPYLFPRLERSIRQNTLKYALQDSGATAFRIDLPLKREMSTERACVDGQMGEVIKCYREWKFSGDDEWLKDNAESIFKMLEYAWSEENPDKWDADMDGIMEGRQHHTLDMELFGPNSWLQGFYLLALYCGAKIAQRIGDKSRDALYIKLYNDGKAWTNANLFNGSYFCQKADLKDKNLVERFGVTETYWNEEAEEIKYQIAEGCMIDQMLADWHAFLIGADGVFDSEKKKIALKNLYQNNYKTSMRAVTNMWRNFAVNDESGTVICSYPSNVKVPSIPIPYCEETMTGFEYALAGLMISEGYVAEGEDIVKAVRERYDGEKRNPWNEIECGSNYARSMSSYALMAVYSGFSFDVPNDHIGFTPLYNAGKYLFSVCESWGVVEFDDVKYCLSLFGEPLVLRSISVPISEKIKNVMIDGTDVDFKNEDGKLVFDKVTICKEILLT